MQSSQLVVGFLSSCHLCCTSFPQPHPHPRLAHAPPPLAHLPLPPPPPLLLQFLVGVLHVPPALAELRTVDEAVVIGAALSLSSSAFVLQVRRGQQLLGG